MQELNPYASPESAIEETPSELRLAGRWARLGASLIDTLLQLAILVPAMWFGGYFSDAVQGVGQAFLKEALWTIAAFAIFALLQGVPLAGNGQTWGKKLLGIRIVDMEGRKPDLWRLLFIRTGIMQAIAAVPYVGSMFALIDVLFVFSADRRCIHDMMADTRVVAAY